MGKFIFTQKCIDLQAGKWKYLRSSINDHQQYCELGLLHWSVSGAFPSVPLDLAIPVLLLLLPILLSLQVLPAPRG
jgi:hypothetical protein